MPLVHKKIILLFHLMKKNYEIVNVYKDVDIPWSIEFLDENTIIYAEKKGEIYIVKNNTAVKVENVPNVYFRGL